MRAPLSLFEKIEDALTVVEHVEDHRRAERREVGDEGTDRDLVAGDAHELAGDDANELGAPRRHDAGELLDRQHVRPLAVHAGDVLGAVDDGDVLVVRAPLGELLLGAVQVADDRDDVFDELAVEGDDEAQHAVGRRVLRPHVDDHLVELEALEVGALAGGGRLFDAPERELHGLVGLGCHELVRHADGSRRGRRSPCAADDR